MSMKFLKLITIVCLICSAFFLNACHDIEEDNKIMITYLDDKFGKNTYTVTQDKYRWFVTLNEYPELTFFFTVVHRPFSNSRPYIDTNLDYVLIEHVVKEYKKTNKLEEDKLSEDEADGFVYSTKVSSLEELKTSYDRLMEFISFASEKYPILIDEGLLNVRMSIVGIRLKGLEDSDKYISQNISKIEKGELTIKPFEEIYDELKPVLKTHLDNPNGFLFHADIGRTIILGSDTFEDCLYKSLVLKNDTVDDVKKIILQPGELSKFYVFKSPNNFESSVISLQAKNLSESPCSLLDAIVVTAYISAEKEVFISPKWIKFSYDEFKEWKDPYEILGISPPKTEKEKTEGVPYRNIKILFEMYESRKEIRGVTLTYIDE